MCSKDKNKKTHVYVQPFYLEGEAEQLEYIVNQWRTLHEILGGGACARSLVRFICPCHGRGVRGHAPMGKF